MSWSQRGGWIASLAIAAWLGLLPAPADAAWLGFRNDTQNVIVVQGASIVNNQPRWGKPYRLFPGEIYWENILIPGNKLIHVYDPKQPNVPLLREVIQFQGADLFYAVETDTTPGKDGKTPAAGSKVKLVPTKPPAPKK